jgi:hypothetical protein
MTTKQITLTLAAAAAFASFTLNAAEPLRSPRAQQNQIRTVSSHTEDRLDRSFKGSPKAELLKTKIAAGSTVDRLARSGQLVSPRASSTFPSLALATERK